MAQEARAPFNSKWTGGLDIQACSKSGLLIGALTDNDDADRQVWVNWWLGMPSPPPITPAFPTTFISHLIGR